MATWPAVWSAPVRYAECDQQGIVFNAHYLTYADEAQTAWLAATGVSYPGLMARGLDMHARASTLEWTAPLRWDEVVSADVTCERIGTSSYATRVVLRVGERVCCTVRTTYVLVGAAGRPVRVPDDLREAWSPGSEDPVTGP